MKLVKWIVAGGIGGLISPGIWAGITYGTGYEIGWIAWLVGIVVGFCVRVAAGDDDGFAPGLVSVVIAVLAILAGKYLAVSFIVDRELAKQMQAEFAVMITPETMQQSICSEVVEEWTAEKKKLNWPPGKSAETVENFTDYPLEVRTEAATRWNALGAEEQQKRLDQKRSEMAEITGMLADSLGASVKKQAFQESFSPLDILFFLLAIGSAFKVGSGATSDE